MATTAVNGWLEVRIAGGAADLGLAGTLRYGGPSDVALRSHWGTHQFPPILADEEQPLPRCFYNTDGGAVLFFSESGIRVIRCLPSDGVCEVSATLFRSDDPELRFVSVRTIGGGRLVLLYERGILVFAANGTNDWHRLHDDISARIEDVTIDVVTIATQWPSELAGQRRVYRLLDGAEV